MSTAPGTRRSLMPRKAMRTLAEAAADIDAVPFRAWMRSFMLFFAVSLPVGYVAFKMGYETSAFLIGTVAACFCSWVAQPLFARIRKSRREAEAAADG